MSLYCTHSFRDEIESLRKNNSYGDVEEIIEEAFCQKTFKDWRTGDLLFAMPTGNPDTLYLKKRLEGKGGYRTYGIAKVQSESFYLGFVHPKTGSRGKENLSTEDRKEVAKDILKSIKNNQLLKIELDTAPNAKWKFKFTAVDVQVPAH